LKVDRRNDGPDVVFLLREVEPALEAAVRELAFRPMAGGFGQVYPEGHPEIDRIFANFRRSVDDLVRQKAGLRPVPWQEALLALGDVIDDQGIDWWLTGSAALAVRGLPIAPRDLDLAVERASAATFEALLIDHVVEPPRPGFISDSFGRAFLYACVDWVAGVDERADRPLIGDVGLTAASRLETVSWRGRRIRVPPLELQLAVNQARGLGERVSAIRRALDDAADGGSMRPS
jgi:hypothetical protein